MNGLLYGTPDYLLKRLQKVKNTAARIVSKTKTSNYITPILKQLHWLPIKMRIEFKICLLVFKGIHGCAPAYITDLLSLHAPSRSLRSAGKMLLVEQKVRLDRTGARAFSYAAAKLWNKLPVDLRTCTEINVFKSQLKTHLFKKAYDN